jgi:hypothetical protein
MSRGRVGLALALVLLAVLVLVAPTPAGWVERVYANGIYPVFQPWMTRASNLVPIPLGELGVAAAVILLLVWIGLAVIRPRAHGVALVVRAPAALAVAYLVFTVNWGLHYRRVPLEESLGYRAERVTPEALRELANRAVSEMNLLHPRLPERWPDWNEMVAELGPAFHRAMEVTGGRTPVLARPKRSIADLWLRRGAVTGYISPLFLEVMVNRALLPFERPHTVAHEWAHLAGRANEAEAEYIAWLTGMYGPAWARYSAWEDIYWTLARALPVAERRALDARIDSGPRSDLRASLARVQRDTRPAVVRVQTATNDRYLRANRVREGVRSYSLVVRLALGVPVPIPDLEPTGEARDR